MNERITESYVRTKLSNLGYYDDETLIIEEQTSEHQVIKKLLSTASKRGSGAGRPEFIIRSKERSGFIIVVECKADIKYHESETLDNYSYYAVDGVLLYSSYLSKNYDVIGIAISGQDERNMKVSHYLTLKDSGEYHPFLGDEILTFQDYDRSLHKSDFKFKQDYGNLLAYTKKLNDLLHTNKIKEAQRSLLISGILIALQNQAFASSYNLHSKAEELANLLFNTIVTEFRASGLKKEYVENLKQAFSFLTTHTTLNTDKVFFEQLIHEIDENINNFIRTYEYFDTIGQFYVEFLRYANNDKGLGIVLTPPHVTDLFVDLAELTNKHIVYDNCCGTGGFLISALKKMTIDAKDDSKKISSIKKNQIVGVEYQDDIFALCISNMIIHGDGKTNIILGDCFENTETIRKGFNPDVGLLNPPYKANPSDIEELDFVLDNLSTLKTGGKCIAIVPMSCALATSGITYERKKALLERHTLEAVMSMPEELFHNSKVAVVTCVMVFTAHKPHPENKKTWLGYWRDDGFEKVKTKGRVDLYSRWNNIKLDWLNNYFNRETISEKCLMKHLIASDEWCIEAYMDTDYSNLSVESFKKNLLEYLGHSVAKGDISLIRNYINQYSNLNSHTAYSHSGFNTDTWESYELDNLFQISLGKPIHKNSLINVSEIFIPNYFAYITRTAINNGVDCYVSPVHVINSYLQNGCAITIGAEGFRAFYQDKNFLTGNKINILRNRNLNLFNSLFINTVLDLEIRKKFNYGRGLVKTRLEKLNLKLPTKNGEPDYQYMSNFIKNIRLGDNGPLSS